jgi:exonuclease VII large subunit
MDELIELKRQLVLGEERLDRTKRQIEELQQQLEQEREQRAADEERSRLRRLESQILEKISGICSPGAEYHLLTLLKSGGFLETESDRISVTISDRYGLPAILPLEAGLPELIRQQFPHFVWGEGAIAPKEPVSSKAEKVANMTDAQLLYHMENPQRMAQLLKDL